MGSLLSAFGTVLLFTMMGVNGRLFCRL